jgi:hypothetical protein
MARIDVTPLITGSKEEVEGYEEVEDFCGKRAIRAPPAWIWKWAASDTLLEIFEEQKSPARKRAIALAVTDIVLLGGMLSLIYFTGMGFVLGVFVVNLVRG